jgi:hypothetical protein
MRQFCRIWPSPAAGIFQKARKFKRPLNCYASAMSRYGVSLMIVASVLAIFVVVGLLLSMVQTPPHIGR